MKRLRFLLDEHVPHAIQDQLLRLSPNMDILIVGQPGAPAKGTSDPDLLQWIEQTGFTLVTNNRRTMPAHLQAHFAAGRHTSGILLLRRGALLGQVIESLFLLWEIAAADEFQDQTIFIPL
ncbi:MAG: hypothetical protein Fur0044_46910 [Anaerolineae bacterium]|nr:DUF5615 family PIN-like protein [Anaerolineales bacterium]MCQ3977374.1 hypothetical protein [Anaerolineae bacterium]